MQSPNTSSRAGAHRMRLVLLIILGLLALPFVLYGAFWSYRFAQSRLGPLAPLAAGVTLAALVAILGPTLLIVYRAPLRAAFVRGLTWGAWLWRRVEDTGIVERFAARYPRLARFLAARFAVGSATGLSLTVGVVALVVIGQTFLDLLVEVVTGSRVVGIDQRILNLVATLRAPELDQVMFQISSLGSARTVLVLAAIAVVVAILAGRYGAALLLVLAIGASELFVFIIKVVIARPRPPLADARITEAGFGFPSGHATLAALWLPQRARHSGGHLLYHIGLSPDPRCPP